jgi:hypothetical protein
LFGKSRIYLDVKKLIGAKGGTRNIPDGYLIDLSSPKKPILWVVENELAKHDALRHIAVQILQMSLSFKATPYKVKNVVKGALEADLNARQYCEAYAKENRFENIDFLLERMIYRNEFQALVIIDELDEDLATVLVSEFQFGVEVLTLKRYRNEAGERIYQFEPLLVDLPTTVPGGADSTGKSSGTTVDTSDIDTIVVPARDEGFNEVFIGENRWWQIRLHTSMIPNIKYIAAYRVKPISAITHVAEVAHHGIEPWQNTGKYVVNFTEPARKLDHPIRLVPKGKVKAPQGPRYTSYDRLMKAKNLDEAF